MCYNYGCGMPNDDMGRGKISDGGDSLTEDVFYEFAEKWGMTLEETNQIVHDLLAKQFTK